TLVVIPCAYGLAYNLPYWMWLVIATLVAGGLLAGIAALSVPSPLAAPVTGLAAAAVGLTFAVREFTRAASQREPLLWIPNP
ncbi:MAG: hypothetical protein AAGF31_05435, partial [Planctomycetota bacterium]